MFAISEIPAGLCVRASSLEVPEQGMTSEVAICGDVVIKRCADARYVDWLRREREVLVALDGCGLSIPRVSGFVDRGTDVWLAIGRLPGVQFSDAMTNAAPERRRGLVRGLGALLRRVHATDIPDALRDPQPWDDRMLDRGEGNLAWCDGTPELLAELRADRPPRVAPTLIHGDLGLDNVLVDGDWMSLIDWPMGGEGDPRFDLAIALQLRDECPFAPAEIAAFYAGYGCDPIDPATLRWFEELWDLF